MCRRVDIVLVVDTVAPIFETGKIVDGEIPRSRPRDMPFDAQQILAEFDAKESQLTPVFTPASARIRQNEIQIY